MVNRPASVLTVFCFLLCLLYVFYWKIGEPNNDSIESIIDLSYKNPHKFRNPSPKLAEGRQAPDESDYEDIKNQLIDLFDDDLFNFSAPLRSLKRKRTISRQVVALENFLEAYHHNITSTREKLLKWMEDPKFRDLEPIDNVADAYKDDFFDRVMKLDSVSTIVLWGESLEEMKKIVPDQHFPYTSSDCRGLENHAIYGNSDGKRFYNVSCSDKLADLWKPAHLDIVRFGMGLPLNGMDTLRKIWNKPKAIPATYILIVKDGVSNSEGDVWVESTKIVIQRCYQDLRPIFPRHLNITVNYKEIFVMTQYFGGSFFHFNVEGLPRLTPHLKWLEQNPHIPILISKPKYKNAFDGFIKVIGLPRERFVFDKIVRAKVLYMPAGGICGRSAVFGSVATSIYLRSRLNAPEIGKQPDSVVIIKRSSRGRLWMNHDEIYNQVKAEADKRSFKTVIFGDKPSPTFEEGMKMFARAVMIIGPHGAGLSNILWSSPGTVIIEGMCDIVPRKVNLCYRNLAQLLGMRWYGIYPGCVHTRAFQVIPVVSYNLDQYLKSIRKGI
ncbi:unnamed protein product [Dimorphilus gyrociliatus]|uniref:Glycosyltransferase 61 catalytic domain-containing protein n=1 Tax=Dimorphilus gyrociliatus TaxID=2664684 RepID=A0A7I8VSU1_9ANNE|nr:unnamed protein product [Dimorphilus gyrociliatus]